MTENEAIGTSLKAGLKDYFRLLTDGAAQLDYQKRAPLGVSVSNELFNQWDDFYDHIKTGGFKAFTEADLRSLQAFDRKITDLGKGLPQWLPAIEEFQTSNAWRELRMAAIEALGALSEE